MTDPQQVFALAGQHHQAGHLAEAERLYRQILSQHPDQPDTLHCLGVIAYQARQYAAAVQLIRAAIALKSQFPEAYSNLGLALREIGRLDEAVESYRSSIAQRPDLPEVWHNLGIALRDGDRIEEAISAYREALLLRPNYLEAQSNLGMALRDSGRLNEALVALAKAVSINPGCAKAYSNLGIALKDNGDVDAAISAYRHAIRLDARVPEAHNNLGLALNERGQVDEAISFHRQAVSLNPDRPEALSNLGIALKTKGDTNAAIIAYRRTLAVKPEFPEALENLGVALLERGQLDEAIEAFDKAISLKPDSPEAHNNLGTALKDKGRLDEAIAAYRRAISLKRGYSEAHSNLIYTLHFHPDCGHDALAQEHLLWNRQYAEPLKPLMRSHLNTPHPGRRLRIGYVSPDLRQHPVGRLLLPLLDAHDKSQVEVFAYSQVKIPDSVTQRLRGSVDSWRNIAGIPDAQTADLIRQDQIDILVDLTLHMANNRLLVFARKPAPVQVTWLAYPSTTGLSTVDYRLSDPYMDPLDSNEPVYSEKTFHLADTFQLYDSAPDEIPITPLPALRRGFLTFGCLNNFCKINRPHLLLWARILQQLRDSRLVLLTWTGDHRQQTQKFLSDHGIASDRIVFPAKPSTHREYLQLYEEIDLGLDSYPYNGHTTSMDSFWMGVPVVSLAGPRAVSRAGLSQCSNLRLPELVTDNADSYVGIAVELGHDLARLAKLRGSLRQRMRQSPLMDAPRFAQNIENAYRKMWQTWCESRSSSS